MPPSAPAARLRGLLLVLGVALLATACQVRVGTDVRVSADGSGRLALTVALDQDLAESLAVDDFDPFAALEELPERWQVERSAPDGGQAVTIGTDFRDPADLADVVGQLQEGLDGEDPRLIDDVQLEVAEDGSASLVAQAGFRPPSSTGLAGAGVRFDGDDLATLLEERGDEVMRVDLRVSMPGPVTESNADVVDGGTATWHLPVTELTEVQVASSPPSDRTWWVVGAAALVGLALGWAIVGLLRRR